MLDFLSLCWTIEPMDWLQLAGVALLLPASAHKVEGQDGDNDGGKDGADDDGNHVWLLVAASDTCDKWLDVLIGWE